MTRGTLFYYESDEKVWTSTEYNGGMYHGNKKNPQGDGDKVIELMSKLTSVDDFKAVLEQINENYGYQEGNNCWPIDESEIKKSMEDSIKWIDNDRPDLKGDKDMDPRTWETIPSFRDVTTWQFWGTPNLSDYSYIFNNSGADLIMTNRDDGEEMIIPDKCCGVLNYGHKDCLCKDGRIIDGMGNYDEDPEEPRKIRSTGDFKYGNKNLTIWFKPGDEWEIVKEYPKTMVIKRDFVEVRIQNPNPFLWEYI